MLVSLSRWTERQVSGFNPWTHAVGVARTLLAGSTALTLALNDAAALFPIMPHTTVMPPYCGGVRAASAFCLVEPSRLDSVRWVAVVLLIVVATGFLPRVMGVVHAWIAFSFASTSPLLDGGDQVAGVLSLLLLTVTLTDPRRWHWQALPAQDRPAAPWRVIPWMGLNLIRLQVAGIYLHAALGKVAVEDWANGTALYYWLRHPYAGVTEPVAVWMYPVTAFGPSLVVLTWSVIVLELLLAVGFLTSRPAQRWLLVAGLALHGGIIVLHGLVSFSLIMWAALLLYLSPLTVRSAYDARRREREPNCELPDIDTSPLSAALRAGGLSFGTAGFVNSRKTTRPLATRSRTAVLMARTFRGRTSA